MSDQRRVQRVEKELQQLVAQYINRDLRGYLRGLVSVSRVESNPKLRTAKIYITVLGSDADREGSLNTLTEATHQIQQFINKQLRMKFVPRISIVLDTGFEKMLKVESLLREISKETKSDEKAANKSASVNSQDED
jgi:ribosome-binding factor A